MRCSVLRLRCRPNASPMRNALAICILVFAVFPKALPSQQSSSTSGATPGWPMHNSAPLHGLPDAVGQMPQTAPQKNGSCLLWVVAEAPGNTVSAATLQIPGKRTANTKKVAAIYETGNSKAPKITCAKRFSCTRAMRKLWSCWAN